MYNSTTSNQESSYSTEAKYTVADILSSMANGEGFADQSYSNGVTSVTTPTSVMTPTSLLTPSTLTSLEQTFMDLQQADNQNGSRTSGFVPPVVDPRLIKQENSEDYYSEDSCDPEWTPPSKRLCMDDGEGSQSPASTPRPGPRRHTGPRPPRKHEVLSPEETDRRKVRRERNKQAAAKCRQRRVDHTNELIQQTEDLEDQKSGLEGEIKTLQQQKEQLEFLLDAHRPLCETMKKGVKAEPRDSDMTDMACQTMAATRPRPTTLPLTASARTTTAVSSVTQATGITINTPSHGMPLNTPSGGVFATLGLDSMVDGHTGLTPITGAPTSCANDMHRHVVDSESSNSSTSQSLNSPTTLIAL